MTAQRPRGGSTPALAPRAGVGLKSEHLAHILEFKPDVGFFEIHAENYMGAGGPPHRYLSAIAQRYPLSLHGVGLSIGAARPLDKTHLERLKRVHERYAPALFSEHLAWSSHGVNFLDDLLPAPYTHETLDLICAHIDQVQETLGVRMALENPATYLLHEESAWQEPQFIAQIAQRTGCSLLLDVNNVFVACTNHNWDMQQYLQDFPMHEVVEIHLAGHSRQTDEKGRPLLIDSHDSLVDQQVWALYQTVIEQTGPLPTLIEWDSLIPAWPILHGQALLAEELMEQISEKRERHERLQAIV